MRKLFAFLDKLRFKSNGKIDDENALADFFANMARKAGD